MKSRLRRILSPIAFAYVLLGLLVYFCQGCMLYHPTRAPEPVMIQGAARGGLVPWRDATGTVIGWKSGATGNPPAANKLIVFHGNAGCAVHRVYYAGGFEHLDQGRTWEVYLFEYPGYGARTGKTNRKSFNAAALEAVHQLLREDLRPLYVLGESIGTGVACDIAAAEPQRVRGVVLVTPFARLTEVAQQVVPFLPASLLLRDRWDNIAALKNTPASVGVLLAGQDEVIGLPQGEKLFANLGDRRARKWLFPNAGHNSIDVEPDAAWWGELSAFLLGTEK